MPNRHAEGVDQFLNKAKLAVQKTLQIQHETVDERIPTIETDQLYIVWFAKILKNWKALVSTTNPDGIYYEVTYNGGRNEMYVDQYHKLDNQVITDKELG